MLIETTPYTLFPKAPPLAAYPLDIHVFAYPADLHDAVRIVPVCALTMSANDVMDCGQTQTAAGDV